MRIKISKGIVARKFPSKRSASEDEFAPLLAGTYQLGPDLEGRLQILREGKSAVFIEPEKFQAHLASNEIELL